jgi:hypothetical protein
MTSIQQKTCSEENSFLVEEYQSFNWLISSLAETTRNNKTQGNYWETQRRFALKTLKDLGFGKQSLESAINIEMNDIIDQFVSTKGNVLLSHDFNVPIINIL